MATAQAMEALLSNPALRADFAASARERVRRYYSKAATDRAYRELYETMLDAAAPAEEKA